MLLQFSVTNYKSLRDTAVLSMVAENRKENPENCFDCGDRRLLKSAVIYGANASGKSNVISAMTAAVMTIRLSGRLPQNAGLRYIVPFAFREHATFKPTSFEFIFVADGIRYVYGFSATALSIEKEYLYRYTSPKRSIVFERDENSDEKYIFTNAGIKRHLEPLVKRNTPQMLFLTTATIWNAEETRPAFDWFMNGIETYGQDKRSLWQGAPLFLKDEDGSLKAFTTRLMQEADINIEDYSVSAQKIENDAEEGDFQVVFRATGATGEILNREGYHVDMFHRFTAPSGAPMRGILDFHAESQGTKELFLFSPFLKNAFDRGSVICVDELGSNAHPLLTRYLIGLFHNEAVNPHHAQIIFTSHQTELLDLELMRRDQIYFTEKDPDTAATELFSLDEFSPRKQEKVRNAYLTGRYGAVPLIREDITA